MASMDSSPAQSAERLLAQAVAQVTAIPDDLVRAQVATELQAAIADAAKTVRTIRRDAVAALNAAGWGYSRIADELGVNKARVQQILNESRPARRDGVIATEMKLAAARMHGAGVEDQEILEDLVPRIRGYRGGNTIGAEAIAEMLDLPLKTVKAFLDGVPLE